MSTQPILKTLNCLYKKAMAPFRFLKSCFCFESLFILWLFSYQFKNVLFKRPDITLLLTCILLPSALFLTSKHKLKNKSPTLSHTPSLIFFLGWSTWTLISFFWSPSSFYVTQKFLCYLVYTIPGMLIAYYIIGEDPAHTKRFLFSILIFSIIVHLWILKDFWVYGIKFRDFLGTNYLVTGQTLGAGLLILLSSSLNDPLKDKELSQKILREVAFTLLASSLVYVSLNLGGRGPLLAEFISIFSLYLLYGLYRPSLFLLRQMLFFLFIGISIIYGFNSLFHYHGGYHEAFLFIERTPHLTRQPLQAFYSDPSITLRLNYYVSTFKMFLASPFRGSGLGSWFFFQNLNDVAWHPHNIFLEILSETGLIGLLLFIGFLYSALRKMRLNLVSRSSLQTSLFLLLIFSFLNALKTGDLNDNLFLFTILGLLARHLEDSFNTSLRIARR